MGQIRRYFSFWEQSAIGSLKSPVAATLVTGTEGNNDAILWTAKGVGTAGNNISVEIVDPSANDASLEVTVSTNKITVSLATDGTGTITSTATEVIAAIEAHERASDMVTVENSGASDGSGTMATATEANLTGGEMEFVDPDNMGLDAPVNDAIVTWQGVSRRNRKAVPNRYSSGGPVNIMADLEAMVWFWKWLLGGISSSGTGGSFTHVITPDLGATMDVFTARCGKDLDGFEHIFQDCAINTINLQSDDIVRMDLDIVGGKDTKGALVDPVEFSEGQIYAPHNMTFDIDDTDESADVETFSLQVTANLNADESYGHGSRFPRRWYRNALDISGEMQLAFEDLDHVERFWTQAGGIADDAYSTFKFDVHIGSNIDIAMPRVGELNLTKPSSDRSRIVQTLSFVVLEPDNVGDGDLITVSVTNSRENYTV